VLARKAGAIRWRESVAPWLYAVAQRVAARARARAARQPAPPAPERMAPDPLEEMSARELLAVVDEEGARPPEGERGAVLLCLVEGRTQEEAARLLGTSLSTVRRRLERGKERLRRRLGQRGVEHAAVLATLPLGRATPPAATLARAAGG